MNKIELEPIDEIVKVLREELEYVEGNQKDGTYYSQWVMAISIKETKDQSFLCRTIIRTSESDFVDGTDIIVNLVDNQAVVDLSFAEEAPMFHGGEIDAAIRWMEEIDHHSYFQGENPFQNENKIKRNMES